MKNDPSVVPVLTCPNAKDLRSRFSGFYSLIINHFGRLCGFGEDSTVLIYVLFNATIQPARFFLDRSLWTSLQSVSLVWAFKNTLEVSIL